MRCDGRCQRISKRSALVVWQDKPLIPKLHLGTHFGEVALRPPYTSNGGHAQPFGPCSQVALGNTLMRSCTSPVRPTRKHASHTLPNLRHKLSLLPHLHGRWLATLIHPARDGRRGPWILAVLTS